MIENRENFLKNPGFYCENRDWHESWQIIDLQKEKKNNLLSNSLNLQSQFISRYAENFVQLEQTNNKKNFIRKISPSQAKTLYENSKSSFQLFSTLSPLLKN